VNKKAPEVISGAFIMVQRTQQIGLDVILAKARIQIGGFNQPCLLRIFLDSSLRWKDRRAISTEFY